MTTIIGTTIIQPAATISVNIGQVKIPGFIVYSGG